MQDTVLQTSHCTPKMVKKQRRAFTVFLAFAFVLTRGYECAWNSANLRTFSTEEKQGPDSFIPGFYPVGVRG